VDAWFPLTRGEADDIATLWSVPKERFTAIGPFVAPEFLMALASHQPPPSPLPPYVCAVARIERRKNFDRLIEALDGLPYEFCLAGQDRGGLRAVRATARRFPRVHLRYLGAVPEAKKVDLLAGATAVVVPSTAEGVPALAIEALALGRPVILAGEAYGPEGPGVLHCGPDVASLRRALESIGTLGPIPPSEPPTVQAAVDRFLSALGD
jgi:glycosyltransferase involved in cell wall biosynthesis